MIYIINSKNNEKIKSLVRLSTSKERDITQTFLIEGFNNLEMALLSNAVIEVYTSAELEINENIPQYIVTDEIMKKISTCTTPQGVVARCKMIIPSGNYGDKIIYLDGVSDPGNLGTILRTALAFGYMDIILGLETVNIYNEKVLAAAQGAIFKQSFYKGSQDFIHELKCKGYHVIASSLKNAQPITNMKHNKKHILILGNEGHGISQELLDLANECIVIPMQNIDSLNVAVACAIMLYELNR